MYKITNKQKGPVQLIVRSRRGPSPRQFTVLNLCGVGKGNNVYFVEDEIMTDYIWKAEREKLVTVLYIDNSQEGVK